MRDPAQVEKKGAGVDESGAPAQEEGELKRDEPDRPPCKAPMDAPKVKGVVGASSAGYRSVTKAILFPSMSFVVTSTTSSGHDEDRSIWTSRGSEGRTARGSDGLTGLGFWPTRGRLEEFSLPSILTS